MNWKLLRIFFFSFYCILYMYNTTKVKIKGKILHYQVCRTINKNNYIDPSDYFIYKNIVEEICILHNSTVILSKLSNGYTQQHQLTPTQYYYKKQQQQQHK